MIRNVVIWLAPALVLISFASCGVSDDSPAIEDSRLRFSADHGIVGPSDSLEVRGEHRVRNTSGATWRVDRVARSCGCLNVEVENTEVSPGKDLVIRYTLDTRGRFGEIVQECTIFCGPGPFRISGKIRAVAASKPFCDPSVVTLARSGSGDALVGQLQIVVADPAADCEIESIPAGMEVELAEIVAKEFRVFRYHLRVAQALEASLEPMKTSIEAPVFRVSSGESSEVVIPTVHLLDLVRMSVSPRVLVVSESRREGVQVFVRASTEGCECRLVRCVPPGCLTIDFADGVASMRPVGAI